MRRVALTAVVVHRNEPEALDRTIAGLRRGWSGQLHVVVVDNASRRPPAPDVPRGATVEVVRTGANAGLLRTRTAWTVVCPHDVDVHPEALDRLVDVTAARPRAGLACAELGLDEVPVVDPYFGGLSVPAVRSGDWAPAGYPHGTMLLARRRCLEEVGLFDERYFAYCEEADLALRARAAGWRCGMVWGALVQNTGISSMDVSTYLKARNTLHLVRRWGGRYKAAVRLAMALPMAVQVAPYRLGVRDFLVGRWGPPPRDVLDLSWFEADGDGRLPGRTALSARMLT